MSAVTGRRSRVSVWDTPTRVHDNARTVVRNRYYQGPVTDHFDGRRFHHPGLPSTDKSLVDIVRWKLFASPARWPDAVPGQTGVRPAERVAGVRITHVGHASYLVQAGGQNVLVDPVWAARASPLAWAGPRRHNPPAVAFEDLPPIDAVLVSHNHYDHLDVATIGRLWQAHRARVITPLGNDAIVRASFPDIGVETGDWWDAFTLEGGLRVTIVPAYHWSARGLRDRRMALWGGFVLDTPAGRVYCAGDTAYRDGAIFREIRARCGAVSVAVVPIGAYAPRWFMQAQHADPQEAVRIARDLGATHALGVHWGTFGLTDEPFDEPAHRFTVGESAADGVRLAALRPGDTWQAA